MSEHVLDTLGMKCPLPIIELGRLVKGLPAGDTVTVLSDDPAAPGDIAAWCRMRGHEHVRQELDGTTANTVVRVRRTPAATAAGAPPPAAPGTPRG